MDPSVQTRGPSGRLLLVLGMHRSGTSCLSGLLAGRGVDFSAASSDPRSFNAKGLYETREFRRLNNMLLQHSGGDWRTPPSDFEVPEGWVEALAALLETLRSGTESLVGLKDPRLLLTWPIVAGHLDRPVMVGTIRRPLDVADSLWRRGGMPIEQGLRLWHRYNETLERLASEHAIPLVDFSADAVTYLGQFRGLATQLGLPDTGCEQDFFDSGLRQTGSSDVPDAPGETLARCEALWDELMRHVVVPTGPDQ